MTTESKELPHDENAEQNVLAACLLSTDALEEVSMTLRPSDFFRPTHRVLYEEMLNMNASGIPVDHISMIDHLRAEGLLRRAGGDAYILELMGLTLSLVNYQHHAEIVKRDGVSRDVISAANKVIALSYNVPENSEDFVAQAQKTILDASEHAVPNRSLNMKKVIGDAYDELDASLNDDGTNERAVMTGFDELDSVTCGFDPRQLIILGARPGVGKSALALKLAINAALDGTHVVFFTFEMAPNEIAQRMMSIESDVPLVSIRRPKAMDGEQYAELQKVKQALQALPFEIVDANAGMTLAEMRVIAKRSIRGYRKSLIIIDYLQLVSPPVRRRAENKNVEVGELTRGLKQMAGELDVPVLALSQLSRSIESRAGKRPQLSDLRDSGSIEQDANIVMFLDRSTSKDEAKQDGRPELGVTRVIVAKNRAGSIGDVDLAFNPETVNFLNYENGQVF